MELTVLVQDIHRLSHELERLERKYGVMSATFYEWYTSGEEPANDAWVLDFEKWAGLYEVWCDRQRAYSTPQAHPTRHQTSSYPRARSLIQRTKSAVFDS
ncbi:MAG TPA: hypothetical protein PKZ84_03655 [Anaerolineae bacterium]|nr:hypothetical protein [Anaerolineae bacterium]HQI86015.1 hypothetical protein [Anaerolineae bacterium]